MTHYCVVRSDLPVGTQAAQLIHAAGYSVKDPLPEGTYAIALQTQDEAELLALHTVLESASIPHKLIIEEDPPYAGQAMAIGIQPMDRAILKPYLHQFTLVAQSDRAPGVMTQEVAGLNPAERANGAFQRVRRWLGG